MILWGLYQPRCSSIFGSLESLVELIFNDVSRGTLRWLHTIHYISLHTYTNPHVVLIYNFKPEMSPKSEAC